MNKTIVLIFFLFSHAPFSLSVTSTELKEKISQIRETEKKTEKELYALEVERCEIADTYLRSTFAAMIANKNDAIYYLRAQIHALEVQLKALK